MEKSEGGFHFLAGGAATPKMRRETVAEKPRAGAGSTQPPENSRTPRSPAACERCGKEFSRADSLRRHMQRKTPCVRPTPGEAPKPKTLGASCPRCGKEFANTWNRDRHVKGDRCPGGSQGEARGTAGAVTNNFHGPVNNTTIHNHTTIHVHLPERTRAFGDENLDYITPRRLQKMLRAIPLTEYSAPEAGRRFGGEVMVDIYGNDDHPENFTAVRRGERSKVLTANGQGEWEVMDLDEVAEKITARTLRLIASRTAIAHSSDEEVLGCLKEGEAKEWLQKKAMAQLLNSWTKAARHANCSPIKAGAAVLRLPALEPPQGDDLRDPDPVPRSRIHPGVTAYLQKQ